MNRPINITKNYCNRHLLDQGNCDFNPYVTKLKKTFNRHPGYTKVYKNFDYSKVYKTIIYDGNTQNKVMGHKTLKSYPYDTIQFGLGDYIHWDYFHNGKLSTWLLIALDSQILYNVEGRLMLCNEVLKWRNKETGKIREYPCVMSDSFTYTNFKFGNRGVVEPGADTVIICQLNEHTKEIEVNDRFLFRGNSFAVKQKNTLLNERYLELYVAKTAELERDNIEDGLAFNGVDKEVPMEIERMSIVPNIDSIIEGQEQKFKLITDIMNVEISVDSDIPKEYYEFKLISPTEFSVLCKKEYTKKPLTISIKDNFYMDTITKNIWLGGW